MTAALGHPNRFSLARSVTTVFEMNQGLRPALAQSRAAAAAEAREQRNKTARDPLGVTYVQNKRQAPSV